MKLFFLVRQALYLFKRSKLKSLLLFFVMTVAIFFPSAAYSSALQLNRDYNDRYIGENAYARYGDLSLTPSVNSVSDHKKLMDVGYLQSLLSFNPSIKIEVDAHSFYESGAGIAAFADGVMFFTPVRWVLTDDGFGLIHSNEILERLGNSDNAMILTSTELSSSFMKNIVGNELSLQGERLVVADTDRTLPYSVGNIKSAVYGSLYGYKISFFIKNEVEENIKLIYEAFSKEFSISDVRIYTKMVESGAVDNFEMMRALNRYDSAMGVTALTLLFTFFCIFNAVSIISAIIKDVSHTFGIKMSIGAGIIPLLLELFSFFAIICLSASVCSVGVSALLSGLFRNYAYFNFYVDLRIFVFMGGASVIISFFLVLFSVNKLQGINLSALGSGAKAG